MPVMAKAPLNSKNPTTVAKKVSGTGGGILGGQGSSEVVCPLQNADGSVCRKKCIGNFAYRSICEHIRRAHPDNWIPKLPASAETFAKMVSLSSRGGIPAGGFPLVRKPIPSALSSGYRKTAKSMPKHDDDQYIDGMSPPSSANESETLPSISLAMNPSNFQSKFPPPMSDFDHEDDDDSFMEDEEIVGDSHEERSGTETEDDERRGRVQHPIFRNIRGLGSPLLKDLNFINHDNHRSASLKRKRPVHPYGDSNESSAYGSRQSSLAASRWDELIEAATTRAVVEVEDRDCNPHAYHHIHVNNDAVRLPPLSTCFTSPLTYGQQSPPSPPTTASSSHAPALLTASPPSSRQSMHSPSSRCLVCANCDNLSPITESFACTECMSGFCGDCAMFAGRRGSCGECRAVGAKFKPLRIVVR